MKHAPAQDPRDPQSNLQLSELGGYRSERRIDGATIVCSAPHSGQVRSHSCSGVRASHVMVRSCPLGHSVRSVIRFEWPMRGIGIHMGQVVSRTRGTANIPKVRWTGEHGA